MPPLSDPPDVEKLAQDCDVEGLIETLSYQKDARTHHPI